MLCYSQSYKVGFYPDIPKPIEFDYLQELVDPPEFWD